MRRTLGRGLRVLGTIAGVGAVTLVLFEGTLRAMPTLIPSDALRIFDAGVRARIAARRGLISALNIEYLPRADGGPPYRLWRFRPGAVWGSTAMDANGFCNIPADKFAKADTFAVVTIGDSFTFCWNVAVDSAWPARLDPMIHRSVYNLGLPDMGLHEDVQLLKRYGLDKRPRVVVLGFYEGNDLRDAAKVEAYRSSMNAGPRQPTGADSHVGASLPRRIFYRLMNNPMARSSYAYNLCVAEVGLLVQRLTEKRAKRNENFRYHLVLGARTIAMNSDNADSDELQWARALDARQVSLDVLAGPLREFVRLSIASRFVPVVCYLPSAHTVYRASVVFDAPNIARLMDAMHTVQLEYLRRMADSLHFRLVDLTGPLREAARSDADRNLLFRSNDLHMTSAGHAVVARSLATSLDSVVRPPQSSRRRAQ